MTDITQVHRELGRLAEAQENTAKGVHEALTLLKTYAPKTDALHLEMYGNEETQHIGLKQRVSRIQRVAAYLAAVFIPSGATAAAAAANPDKASKISSLIHHLLG